jgi:hypothetical protein
MVCILLATLRMPMTRRRILPVATAGLLAITWWRPATAIAQDESKPPPHVRPEKALRALVDEAARRAPLVRTLIDQLEDLDVTVYIRVRAFDQLDLDGQIAMLATPTSHRYLVIELACGRLAATQMATLGHELFHATEIAAEPWVVDAESLAALYTRIGIQTGSRAGRRTFETAAAAAAGERARRELRINTARSTNGT